MSMGTAAFEAVYTGMTGARCEVRQGRSATIRGLCPGISAARMDSEMGQFVAIDATLRILASEVPDSVDFSIGKKIEISASDEGWQEYRICGRTPLDGVIRYRLEWPNE